MIKYLNILGFGRGDCTVNEFTVLVLQSRTTARETDLNF
jgi:hypothetical protein